MTDRTANFRFEIPNFDQDPWHEEMERTIRAVDTAIYQTLIAQNVTNWANSTAYAVTTIVLDPEDGTMWICAIAHTSPASPTTFATFRASNPTYWNATATIPQQRGAWT